MADSPAATSHKSLASAADPRPVRIGVQIQPQHAEYDEIRRAVAQAEEIGVDVVFNWDHFSPQYGET